MTHGAVTEDDTSAFEAARGRRRLDALRRGAAAQDEQRRLVTAFVAGEPETLERLPALVVRLRFDPGFRPDGILAGVAA